MSLRDELLRLRAGLGSRDPAFCGEARLWLIQSVEEQFDRILMNPDRLDSQEAADEFSMSAGKILADGSYWDLETLMRSVHQVSRSARLR